VPGLAAARQSDRSSMRPPYDVRVELRQLEYFAAVARHRHFTRAADELYVTQSALSQQVRRLEEELGLALLLRTSRGVELTPAGEDLLARAESILAEVERARTDMDEHAGASRGLVRVAATTGDAVRLPRALATFHAEHPGIRIGLRHGSSGEVVELVRAGAADLAVIGTLASDAPGLASTLVGEEDLCVMCAPDEPLADSGEIGFAALRGRSLVLAEPGSPLRSAVGAACADAGFSPVPLFEVSDPWTVRFLTAAGLGLSVVPRSWLDLPGPPIAHVALTEPAPRHCVSLLAPAAGLSPAATLLHEHLTQRLTAPPPASASDASRSA
jgi:DNA-binding transcriptional LysR family regulator